MIAFLDGILAAAGTEAVVQVGGGIGLDVRLSARSADRLPAVGEPVRLWTHLAVREDNWSLYGFVESEERAMFRLLISVSGVGPKVALNMLSKASAADIAQYLQSGDEKSLTTLPGIGKKSAARLVVELGRRVADMPLGVGNGEGDASGDRGSVGAALSVLTAMGMPAAQAERALSQARRDQPTVIENLEEWVRAALRVI